MLFYWFGVDQLVLFSTALMSAHTITLCSVSDTEIHTSVVGAQEWIFVATSYSYAWRLTMEDGEGCPVREHLLFYLGRCLVCRCVVFEKGTRDLQVRLLVAGMNSGGCQ